MVRVRHWQEDWGNYHVTTRTLDQAFHLARDDDKLAVIQPLAFYQRRGDFVLYAYVIMNNHVHLVIQPSPEKNLSHIMRDIKKWSSRHNTSKPPGTPLWERRFDDNSIRSDEEMTEIVNYIHNNPVRAGLVAQPEDYLWSSARNYAGLNPILLPVTTDWR